MAKKKKKQSSLVSHMIWGSFAGAAGYWVAGQYWRAFPEPLKESINEGVDSVPAEGHVEMTESQKYMTAAGVGALYGIATYFIPALAIFRKILFAGFAWGFRGSKIVALLTGMRGAKTKENPIIGIAKRSMTTTGLEKVFQRAER